jgi:hypothetical protein
MRVQVEQYLRSKPQWQSTVRQGILKHKMNIQDKSRTSELEASEARVEQNAAELQRHEIAAAALTEAANREVAHAKAIDARMTADREALAAQKIAAERAVSARNKVALFLMTGLLIVILVVGGIYFYKNKGAAGAAKSDTSVGMITSLPQANY